MPTISSEKTYVFESMPVRQAVLKQAMPAVASQMVVLIYNLADTYFVGMLDDPVQTAAVTVAFPAFLMLTAISNLFGVGGASRLAQALGRKREDQAAQISAVSFWGGVFCALLYSLLFALLARPILTLCGAKADIYDTARNYAQWVIVIGALPTVMNTLLANLTRAEGSAGRAFWGVTLGGLLNIALDPIFILPQFLGMGAAGAGAATMVSNLTAALFLLSNILLRPGSTVLRVDPRLLRYAQEHVGRILSIGFPSALQIGLTVVAVAAQAKFVSKYATEAVAGLGIAKKIDNLTLYFSIGVANGILPMLAYNFSSGNQQRRRDVLKTGCAIALGFSLFTLVLFELFAPQCTALFIDDPLTIRYGAAFLRRLMVSMPCMSLCYPRIIHFQAIGKVRQSLICSVLRKGVLDIPLLFLMDRLFPLYGCMWVQTIVDAISLTAILYFNRGLKKEGL